MIQVPFRGATAFSRTSAFICARFALYWGTSLGLLLALLPLSIAAPSPRFSIEDLTRKSDLVAHATVTAIEASRDPENRLFTRIELDVHAVWKGAARRKLILLQPGGTLGDRAVIIVGQPRFELNEEVVAFVTLNPDGSGVLVELGQGKFSVAREDQLPMRWVSNGIWGRPLASTHSNAPPTLKLPAPVRMPSPQPLSFETLHAEVRRAAALSPTSSTSPPSSPNQTTPNR